MAPTEPTAQMSFAARPRIAKIVVRGSSLVALEGASKRGLGQKTSGLQTAGKYSQSVQGASSGSPAAASEEPSGPASCSGPVASVFVSEAHAARSAPADEHVVMPAASRSGRSLIASFL